MTMKSIYFVGAGGIGMSALERYFKAEGYKVGGYDKTPSSLTETLISEGIDIHFEDDIEAVDPVFQTKPSSAIHLQSLKTTGNSVISNRTALRS